MAFYQARYGQTGHAEGEDHGERVLPAPDTAAAREPRKRKVINAGIVLQSKSATKTAEATVNQPVVAAGRKVAPHFGHD